MDLAGYVINPRQATPNPNKTQRDAVTSQFAEILDRLTVGVPQTCHFDASFRSEIRRARVLAHRRLVGLSDNGRSVSRLL